MKNPFKKYGHIKTRYDEIKEFDNRLKNKTYSYAKLYVVSNPEFLKFIDTNLGIPYKPKVETVKQWSERLKCQKQ